MIIVVHLIPKNTETQEEQFVKINPFIKHKYNELFVGSNVVIGFIILNTTVDSLIVGNVIGETALSAINLFAPILGLITFVSALIAMGAIYLFSNYIGKFEKEKANQIFSISFFASIFFGIILFLLMIICGEYYINASSSLSEITTELTEYWRTRCFAVLLEPLLFLMTMIVSAEGDVLIRNITSLLPVAGGIPLSIILSKHLGIKGIAISFLIVTTLALLVSFAHFFRKSNNLKLYLYFNFKEFFQILQLSFNDASTYLCIGLFSLMLNKFISATVGDFYLPVASMALNVIEISIIFDAVGDALNPIAETYLGENHNSLEKNVAEYSLRISAIEGLIVMALIELFAGYIPTIFGISDPLLVEKCVIAIRILGIGLPVTSVIFLLTSQYLLARRIKLAVTINVCEKALLSIPVCLLSSKLFGFYGYFAGYVISSTLLLIFFLTYIRTKYGKEMFPFMLKDEENEYFDYSFVLDKDSIMNCRNAAKEQLDSKQISPRIINKLMQFIEESGLLILENNKNKKILINYTLTLEKDSISIIVRDNGKYLNLTDQDNEITNFRMFFLESIIASYSSTDFLVTTSYNRSEIRLTL